MIDRVERFVLNNRRIKVAEIASECGISNGSAYTIIHEHLGMSKISARWVPRNLNMQDRQQRVGSSQELLEVYNANPEDFHTPLVTGDETWLHQWDQDTKKEPCNGSALAHPSLRNFVPNHQQQGNGHGVLGLQRDYIDKLQACWYFNYRRMLCQCHSTIMGCY